MKIQSLRGMHDLFPTELEKWYFFESKLLAIFNSYNVKEIRTPILESEELFSRSVGNSSDIVNKELYSFSDRNDEIVCLRPEGSASVIRAIIQKKLENEKHKLWYQGPMFRYERPQKGRFRQFHQVGVEYLGYEEGFSEYELISMILHINRSLDIDDYIIKINHLGDPEAKEKFSKSLISYLEPYKSDLHATDQIRLNSNPLRVLDSKEKSTIELLKNAPKFDEFISKDSRMFLNNLVNSFIDSCNIQIDKSLVRGLDYYNGMVFEVISKDLGAQDSFLGGGRYDNLSNNLGGKNMHALGFAIGIERILNLIKIKNCDNPIKVGFINAEKHIYEKTYKIVNDLRDANNKIILETFLSDGSLKSQLRKANKKNCGFVIIVGMDELNNNQIIWKNLSKSGEQELLSIGKLFERYKNL